MRIASAEIIAIGTEILLGDIINTNAAYLAREMAGLGINVYRQQVVGDNPQRLREALETARDRADLVITSGGLGPTQDDLSKETAAACFGRPLRENPEARQHIEEWMRQRGGQAAPNNWKQALLPEGSVVFQNHNGTAPAFALSVREKMLIMLPGPPSELIPLFEEQVKPYLRPYTESRLVSKTLHLCGIGESDVEYRLRDRMRGLTNPTLAPYAKEGAVDLRITAKAATEEEARRQIEPVEAEIRQQFGPAIFGTDGDTLEGVLVRQLQARGWTVTTAESCTAGLVSGQLVNYPGASDVLSMAFVTYSNEAKQRLLGVRAETLQKYGAVSEPTAREMASGAAQAAGAQTAIAVTGLAGPGGGTPELPVGTIWIAAYCNGRIATQRLGLSRQRNANRHTAAVRALDLLRRMLLEEEPSAQS